MNQKLRTITDLRWGLLPYTAGSGLHVGGGAGGRLFHNAIICNPENGPAVDLLMQLDRLPIFADGAYDFVVVGGALAQVKAPRQLLAECWRVLRVGGCLSIVRPTPRAYEWLLADAADYVVLANLELGVQRVDVVQKLGAGEGRLFENTIATDKTLALIRTGGFGDALWAASVLPALKAEGYHITMYVGEMGEQVLRHDPNVDRIIVTDDNRLPAGDHGPFWEHERQRYERLINLVECVEKNMLAVPHDLRFYWPAEERRRVFGGNYLEAVHRLAAVPRKFAQKFYPTPAERTLAEERKVPGKRTAVFAVSGSSLPKFWPYASELIDGLIARGYAVWAVGELRDLPIRPRPGLEVVGVTWSIRDTLAFSQVADLVVGQETGILNAVAFEAMRKVVLLSHSTAKNLTLHWTNTVALHGDAPCWPCHQIHYVQAGWEHCNQDQKTKQAKCQATISVDQVLAAVDRPFVVRAAA